MTASALRSASVSAAAKALALTLAAVLALSGCSLLADITTSKPYDPSDGVGIVSGDVAVQNFLVVTTGEGEEAVLVGSVTNNGLNRAAVDFARVDDDAALLVVLNAGETARLGVAPGRVLVMSTAEIAPGGVAEITVSVRDGDTTTLWVPVVDGTLPEYARVLEEISGE